MRKSLLCTAVWVVMFSTVAWAQSSGDPWSLGLYMPFDFTGGGARAEGMGKAFLGVSDDITAGSWNPAGLVALDGPMLGLGYGAVAARGRSAVTIQSHLFGQNHDGNVSSVSDLTFVAPFRLKGHPFVGSFGYTDNCDGLGNLSYDVTVIGMRTVIRQNIVVRESYDIDVISRQHFKGSLKSLNFALGTRLYENVSAGVTANVYTGETVAEGLSVNGSSGWPLEPGEQPTTLTQNILSVDTNKFSGFNLTLGAKRSGDRTSIGLVVRSPFSLSVKTGTSIYSILYRNNLPIADGTDTIFYDNQLTKYTMPLMVGVGVGHRLRENLLLTGDAEYRAFGKTKTKVRESLQITPAGNTEEVFQEFDTGWNNGVALRFGGEYLLKKSFGVVPLRAGVGFTPTPAPNDKSLDHQTPSRPLLIPHAILAPLAKLLNKDDTPLLYSFALGTGIHWSQIHLDMAYTYRWVDRNGIEAGGGQIGNVIIDVRNRDHQFGFTFTGYF